MAGKDLLVDERTLCTAGGGLVLLAHRNNMRMRQSKQIRTDSRELMTMTFQVHGESSGHKLRQTNTPYRLRKQE